MGFKLFHVTESFLEALQVLQMFNSIFNRLFSFLKIDFSFKFTKKSSKKYEVSYIFLAWFPLI